MFLEQLQKGPETYPASYTMGKRFLSEVKRPGFVADHLRPPLAKAENEKGYVSTPP
jgi:hypothetical protein